MAAVGRNYNSTRNIGDYAFSGNRQLTDIMLPDSVTSIGAYAFENDDNLTNVSMSGNMQSIGDCAFRYCDGLTSFTIEDGVQNIGERVFNDCSNLKNFNCSGKSEYFATIDGVLFDKREKSLVCFPEGKDIEEYLIPDGIKMINAYAFSLNKSITSIIIPDSVNSIEDYAFYRCENLINVNIPEQVTSIGQGAFNGCYNLKDIDIPEGVTSIGTEAFKDCENLTSITIPESVTYIGEDVFDYCYNCTIYTPNNMIAQYAYENDIEYVGTVVVETIDEPVLESSDVWTDAPIVSTPTTKYWIVDGYSFHNGKAFMYLTEDYDDYFWGWVNSDFELEMNFKEEYGFAQKYLGGYPDSVGNISIRLNDAEQLVFYNNGSEHTIIPLEKMEIMEQHDGYFTFRRRALSGYQVQEATYGVLDNYLNIIYEANEDDLITPLNEPSNEWRRNYGHLFIDGYLCTNIDTLQEINPLAEYQEEVVATTKYGYIIVYGRFDDYLKIVDDSGNMISKFSCDIDSGSWGYDRLLYYNNDYIAITGYSKGYIYTKEGKKVFDSTTLGNVEVMNISVCENNDFVILLRGMESDYNYITVMDQYGNFYFDPIRCKVNSENRTVYHLEGSDFAYNHELFVVPTETEETTIYDFNGNPLFTISNTDASYKDGFAFSRTNYAYYDINGIGHRLVRNKSGIDEMQNQDNIIIYSQDQNNESSETEDDWAPEEEGYTWTLEDDDSDWTLEEGDDDYTFEE